jgi:hypothetical protein
MKMLNVNNTTLTQIAHDLVMAGYSESSDFIVGLTNAQQVEVLGGDCCLVTVNGCADFYFRTPLSTGPRWGYRHSYRSPRRPHDAGRYLAHGREEMRKLGWA